MASIVECFADVCRAGPGRLLIHLPGTGGALCASDIWDAHGRYAESMAAAGIARDQLVVSAAGNHPASVGFLLACRALEVAVMSVDAGTPLTEILDLAERFAAAALLLPTAMAADEARLPPTRRVDLTAGLQLLPRAERLRRTYPGTAVLKLTSGSTGAPKAALTSEAQLVGDGTQIIGAMGIRPSDTQIAAIPLSHSYGLGVLLMPLLLQGTAIVVRDSFIPQHLPDDATHVGARLFPGVPFMFQYFIANPPPHGWPACLDRLISAGAPLTPATIRAFHDRFGIKIHSFYGTTETGGIAFDDSDEIHDGMVVGRALPGVTIALRPEGDMPPGAGRIHVRSAAVTGGYSDETRDGFDEGGFLTGDYGAWDARQQLTLLGRVSAFVNVAGRKVQPDEVEQVLRTMPGVVDVRVLAAPDARRGQQIVACIVSERANGGISTLSVRQFCAARLAAFKIPRTIIFLDEIPLTSRGKTDRTALADLVRPHLAMEHSSL